MSLWYPHLAMKVTGGLSFLTKSTLQGSCKVKMLEHVSYSNAVLITTLTMFSGIVIFEPKRNFFSLLFSPAEKLV